MESFHEIPLNAKLRAKLLMVIFFVNICRKIPTWPGEKFTMTQHDEQNLASLYLEFLSVGKFSISDTWKIESILRSEHRIAMRSEILCQKNILRTHSTVVAKESRAQVECTHSCRLTSRRSGSNPFDR